MPVHQTRAEFGLYCQLEKEFSEIEEDFYYEIEIIWKCVNSYIMNSLTVSSPFSFLRLAQLSSIHDAHSVKGHVAFVCRTDVLSVFRGWGFCLNCTNYVLAQQETRRMRSRTIPR